MIPQHHVKAPDWCVFNHVIMFCLSVHVCVCAATSPWTCFSFQHLSSLIECITTIKALCSTLCVCVFGLLYVCVQCGAEEM